MSDLLCNIKSLGQVRTARGQLAPWKNDLLQECERIKEGITRFVFSNVTDAVLERYVQYHQTGIIELADRLQPFLAEPGGDNERDEIINFFASQLFLLLGYIERFFTKYFNNEEKLPQAYRGLILREMSGAIDALITSVNERIVSEPLKKPVLGYLSALTSGSLPPNFNFRNLIYLKAFAEELTAMFAATDVPNWDAELSSKLIYLNFNHLSFLSYLQNWIRGEAEQAESREKFRELLLRYLSDFKGLKCKPGYSYHPEWPEIKVMVESWIQDEMLIFSPNVQPEAAHSKYDEDDKLLVQFSVAQLALVIRLLYEEGCFGNASVTDVLKFTARHYRSKRQQQISPGSLSKEYYAIAQVTAAFVRGLFQDMIVRINKSYFPVWGLLTALLLY